MHPSWMPVIKGIIRWTISSPNEGVYYRIQTRTNGLVFYAILKQKKIIHLVIAFRMILGFTAKYIFCFLRRTVLIVREVSKHTSFKEIVVFPGLWYCQTLNKCQACHGMLDRFRRITAIVIVSVQMANNKVWYFLLFFFICIHLVSVNG